MNREVACVRFVNLPPRVLNTASSQDWRPTVARRLTRYWHRPDLPRQVPPSLRVTQPVPTRTRASTHAHTHTHTLSRTHTQIHVQKRNTRIPTRIYRHKKDTYKETHTLTHTHTHTPTRKHTHTHTHTHKNTQTHVNTQSSASFLCCRHYKSQLSLHRHRRPNFITRRPSRTHLNLKRCNRIPKHSLPFARLISSRCQSSSVLILFFRSWLTSLWPSCQHGGVGRHR
jgi:hypothetical protein